MAKKPGPMARSYDALKNALPVPLRDRLRLLRFDLERRLLWTDWVVDYSKLRRLTPYRKSFGWRRGKCIDRYYIEKFMSANRQYIRGDVLEIGDNTYTKLFLGDDYKNSHIGDIDPGNRLATILFDLENCNEIEDKTFDTIILTQVLQYMENLPRVVRNLHRILRPGGAILATIPGIVQLMPSMSGIGTEYWRFTRHSVELIFRPHFKPEAMDISTFGNVLSAVAFLHGLVVAELKTAELEYNDPDYEVIISIRATRSVMP
jgi:SAM-dependent methyltransferase